MLRKWRGELKFLPNFKFRRFGKKHLRDAIAKGVINQSSTEPSISSSVNSKVENIKNNSTESVELNCLSENTTDKCEMGVI